MDNTYEELYKIYTQLCLDSGMYPPEDSIVAKQAEIFIDSAVKWTFCPVHIVKNWVVSAHVDFHTRETYQVDVIDFELRTHSRWVNWKYKNEYGQNLFDSQIESTMDQYSIPLKMQYGHDSDGIIQEVKDVIASSNDPADHVFSKTFYEDADEETITLDLTDSEIALIARAAHAEDITINEFMNKAIKEELDKAMPDWREEYRKNVID